MPSLSRSPNRYWLEKTFHNFFSSALRNAEKSEVFHFWASYFDESPNTNEVCEGKRFFLLSKLRIFRSLALRHSPGSTRSRLVISCRHLFSRYKFPTVNGKCSSFGILMTELSWRSYRWNVDCQWMVASHEPDCMNCLVSQITKAQRWMSLSWVVRISLSPNVRL